MPFDGSGNYTRVHDWTDDRDAGIKIQAVRMDEECDDIALALNQVFFRNGLVQMTGDLAMGGNDISQLGNGTAAVPAIRFQTDADSGFYHTGTALGFAYGGVVRATLNGTALAVTGNVTATGNVTGVAGTFSGNVSGVNGTFSGTVTMAGSTVWTAANDGAGSGLDADLLDGAQGSDYARISVGNVFTSTQIVSNATPTISMYETDAAVDNKDWRLFVNSSIFQIRAWNDAGTVSVIPFSVTRSGTSITSMTFTSTALTHNGSTIWTAANDGSGSGLDADLLDGLNSIEFAQLASANTFTQPQTVSTVNPYFRLNESDAAVDNKNWLIDANSGIFNIRMFNDAMNAGGNAVSITRSGNTATAIALSATALTHNGSTVWTAANDGAGSGLDADLLDGVQGSDYARISVGNSFTATQSILNGSPTLLMNETDAAVDSKDWRIFVNGGVWRVVAWNDAATISSSPITITRSGTSITAMALASTTLTHNGNTVWTSGNDGAGSTLDADLLDGVQGSDYARISVANTFTANQRVNGTNPALFLYETDVAADQKWWGIDASASVLSIKTLTDAGGSAASPLAITRSGTTVTAINLAATDLTFNSKPIAYEGGARPSCKITDGTAAPAGGTNGDLYFQYT